MSDSEEKKIEEVCAEIEKFHKKINEQKVKVYTKEKLLQEFDEVITKMNDIADQMTETETEMLKKEKDCNKDLEKKIEETTRVKALQPADDKEKQKKLKKCQELLKEIKSLKCEMEYANSTKENVQEIRKNANIIKEKAETAKTRVADAESSPNLEKEVQELEKIKAEAKVVEQEANEEWDEYYMNIACLAALRSKDPSTPVGACIADTESCQVVGIGYNSMPYVEGGNNDKIFPWKGSTTDKINPELKYPYVVHAAVNAIASKPSESIEGCTIYLTHCPDKDCVQAIIKAKIKKIVYCMFTRHDEYERETEDDMEVAKKILERNAVKIRKFKNENAGGQLKDRIDRIRPRYTKKNKDECKWPTESAKDFIPWETFFMEIALLSKERSAHSEYQVGACVVSPKKQVLAVGYNAYPEDMIHEETEDEKKDNEEESEYISHAEYKAILGISPSVQGCTLYVTQYPCHMCAKVIVQSGIREVIYDEDGGWKQPSYISSRKILTTCLGTENINNIRSYDKKLV
ncbi:PREDICTED: uncharacterized protein LOC109587434 [Amphimedon queenslandica]|uniref:dCMP deaminase n=1 Tax=Amphimedon queenslandica TaxID=400682 RepID=A0AAN0JQW9_AMPQE|nr:PREDICTED: uncharacterized protein LOC109587434 [Amphimedon queenslandica]|eukprot:XP_019859232.1 PREDICTED: uncharacterized protein LOC109587434 [Amphimedon queenslandica]